MVVPIGQNAAGLLGANLSKLILPVRKANTSKANTIPDRLSRY